MALEIKGKLIQKLNKTEGVSKAGKAWTKQEFVLETEEQYPRKVCISVMNEKVTELDQYAEGSIITASINVESREWNGKWYTDVRAWRLQGSASNQTDSGSTTEASSMANNEPDSIPPASVEDDLPF